MSPSSVDEMVLAFLRAEADGPRHRQAFAYLDRRLIDQADLTDTAQNSARMHALAAYRGDLRTGTGYLGRLPGDTRWERWGLASAELGEVRYANYVTWQVLSGDSRRIRDGAANVRQGLVVLEGGFDVSAGIREAARAIDDGREMPELIAVADSRPGDAGSLVLLEGHTRSTAYLVARKPPSQVLLLVGWSTGMAFWPWF